MKKSIIAILVTVLILAIGIAAFLIFTRSNEQDKEEVREREVKEEQVNVFNQKMSVFYDQYAVLQQERVRLSKLGYDEAGEEQILDQMAKTRDQASQVYTTLKEMEDIARDLEEQEKEQEQVQVGLIPMAWAKDEKQKPSYRQKYGLVGAILSKLPVVGKLVDGFDTVHESVRIGIYKAYKESSGVDTDILDEELKLCGLNKIEDVFTCNFTVVDTIMRRTKQFPEGLGYDFRNEISLAKEAAKLGQAATLAYVDGILAATGSQGPDEDILPTDLEDYLKIMLDAQEVQDYINSKKTDIGMKIFRKVVEPEETQKQQEEIITTVVNKKVRNVVEEVIGDEDKPYDELTPEQKRELAEKLNKLEKEGALIIVRKDEVREEIELPIPEGEWDVLCAEKEMMPAVSENVIVKEESITNIINMVVQINYWQENPDEFLKILEKSKVYEPGEEVTIEEIENALKDIIESNPEAIGLSGIVTVNESVFSLSEDDRTHKRKGSGTINLVIIGTQVSGSCNISAKDYWKCPIVSGDSSVGHCLSVFGGKYDSGSWVPGTAIDIPGGSVQGTYYPSSGKIEAWLGEHAFTGTLEGEIASGRFYYELPNGQPHFYWSVSIIE